MFALFSCLASISAFAYTPAETNEVAESILWYAAMDNEDNLDVDAEYPVLFSTWAELVGGDEPGGRTFKDKEKALDNYLFFQATNDCRNLSGETKELLRIALCEMRDLNYTNALPIVSKWMVNPHAVHRDDAIFIYYLRCTVNPEFITNTELLLTNATWTTQEQRSEAIRGAVGAIRRFKGTNQTDVICRNMAVDMLYRTRFCEILGADPLDSLFVDMIPGYEFSTNRLNTIAGWLSDTNRSDYVKPYLISVTNQMMQTMGVGK